MVFKVVSVQTIHRSNYFFINCVWIHWLEKALQFSKRQATQNDPLVLCSARKIKNLLCWKVTLRFSSLHKPRNINYISLNLVNCFNKLMTCFLVSFLFFWGIIHFFLFVVACWPSKFIELCDIFNHCRWDQNKCTHISSHNLKQVP